MESKLHRVLMVALLLVALFNLMPAAKVSAYTTHQLSGRQGDIRLPIIILETDGYGGWYFKGSSTTDIYRSPSSTGTQIIQVTYIVQRWDGRQWITVASDPRPAQVVGTNQFARFTAPNLWPQFVRGYHRFAWRVDWKNAYGTMIAQSMVHTSKATEYYCTSSLCTAYTDGSVYLNGFFSN